MSRRFFTAGRRDSIRHAATLRHFPIRREALYGHVCLIRQAARTCLYYFAQRFHTNDDAMISRFTRH